MKKIKIPKGLHRCRKCGEYKGRVKPENLPFFYPKKGKGYCKVCCICDGAVCQRCKKNKVHHPVSNFFDPQKGITYVPWTRAFHPFICAECQKKSKKRK